MVCTRGRAIPSHAEAIVGFGREHDDEPVDFTAYTLHLGYFPSAILFAALIALPAIGYRWLRLDAVFAFWAAYIVTRPLGASIADGLGKAKDLSGLGYGDGAAAIVFAALIAAKVLYLAMTKADVQTTAPAVL